MRDVEAIDEDLAVLVRLRFLLRNQGVRPSSTAMDQLLDERLLLTRTAAVLLPNGARSA